MNFFNTMKHLLGVKTEQTGENLLARIAKADPTAMGEVALRQLEEEVNKITQEVASAKVDYMQEKKEADEAQNTYNDMLLDAEFLQNQLVSLTDGSLDHTQTTDALTELLNSLETFAAEVEREAQEALDAKEVLDELDTFAREVAAEYHELVNSVKSLANGMKKAEVASQRAKRTEERNNRVKGLKGNRSTSGAMEAMQQAINDTNKDTDARNLKSELLGAQKKITNPALEAAKAARTTGSIKTGTVADRLAALNKLKV